MRKIQVNIEDILSEELEIDNGVPQGSGISTLLFDLILSNIPRIHPVKSKEFADDVAFSITADSIEDATLQMQDAIERFVEYIKAVGLKISAEKTKVMCFTLKKNREPNLTLEGQDIEIVTEFKYLGMVFDAPRLTWNKHVQHIRNRCQQGLNVMKYITSSKWGADRGTMLMMNSALVKSRLTYGSPALISMSKTNYRKLETIQNQGIRIATGCLKPTFIPALQAEANVIPLDIYIKQQAIKYYYRIKIQEEGHCIKDIIFNDENLNDDRVYNERAVRKPFVLKTMEIMREWRLPITPNIRNLEYPCIPPWDALEKKIRPELLHKITKNQSEIQLKNAALETIELLYEKDIKIYTDGSKKSQPLSTTAAYCIPNRNIKVSWKLHPNISIEGAELSAIVKATEWIKETDIRPSPVVILSDSKVSLQLILQRKPKNYEYGVNQIHKNLRELGNRGWEVKIQWIPSHCGVKGNEEADTLANIAHEVQEIENYPIEKKRIGYSCKKCGTETMGTTLEDR